MIRNIPGFAPIATDGDKVPTAAPKAETPPVSPYARETQVLSFTRQRGRQEPLKQTLRTDGPTLEMWLRAGYDPNGYPPVGYAELDSPALVAYKAEMVAATSKEPPAGSENPAS